MIFEVLIFIIIVFFDKYRKYLTFINAKYLDKIQKYRYIILGGFMVITNFMIKRKNPNNAFEVYVGDKLIFSGINEGYVPLPKHIYSVIQDEIENKKKK